MLIAECKSRIDKGLMTDVLDEFDRVVFESMVEKVIVGEQAVLGSRSVF